MTREFAIDRALFDQRLLGAGLGDPESWLIWRAVLMAAFGLPLDASDTQLFLTVAGTRKPPTKRVRELWCIAGRRSGKSRIAAALAVYFAAFVKHKLAPGEVGMVLVIAGSRDQARTVFSYIKGFLNASPTLAKEVENVTATEIILRSGIVIGVHANSFRTVRGRTLVAAIFDEIGFWRAEDSATPDIEVYRAVLPALATTNGMLVGISTPYRKAGLLHQKHRDYYGVDNDDTLVVQGASPIFNKTLSEAVIAAQRANDPTAALSEWDGVFRADIASFLDDDLIDAAVEQGRPLELPPQPGIRYFAFTDASGGVGSDSYTLSIGHKENDATVIDVVRGTAGKFDPAAVTREYAALLKEYHVGAVVGDNYAAQWVAGAWRDCNISYVKSDRPKGQLYIECVPIFARGLVKLPNHAKLVRELRLLERHVHRSGKDTVEHPKGGRDDHANAVCGLIATIASQVFVTVTPELLQQVAMLPRRRAYGSMRSGNLLMLVPPEDRWTGTTFQNPNLKERS